MYEEKSTPLLLHFDFETGLKPEPTTSDPFFGREGGLAHPALLCQKKPRAREPCLNSPLINVPLKIGGEPPHPGGERTKVTTVLVSLIEVAGGNLRREIL